MKCSFGIVVVLAFTLGTAMASVSGGQEKKAPSLDDDFKALRAGEWKMPYVKSGTSIYFSILLRDDKQASFEIIFDGRPVEGAVVGFKLVEKNESRHIVFSGAESAPGLPKSVIYRFEGKQLIITIEEGKHKGDYKLNRSDRKK